jgi:energy-coupling factor transporter ATP-binding protein EcfA2
MGRAIVRNPKVFLMDEPLSNLDAKLRVQMRTEISKLYHRLNTTIIYVTHDQTEAMTLGTRIVVMNAGEIQQVDTPKNLYDHPLNLFVATFIGSPEMNHIVSECTVENGKAFLKFGNTKISLPEEKSKILTELGYDGKKVMMGIRPENIHDAEYSLEQYENSIEVDVCTIGSKAEKYFKKLDVNLVAQVSQLGDSPEINDVIGSIKIMLDNYMDGNIDELHLAENKFINTMSQEPGITHLLPTEPNQEDGLSHHWDYIYEPDSKSVIDNLLIRYIESLVYQGIVENVACEMSARMVAMKSASDNASDLIGELQLIYNKARQASITQELSEIVAGAAAV